MKTLIELVIKLLKTERGLCGIAFLLALCAIFESTLVSIAHLLEKVPAINIASAEEKHE